MMPAISPFLVLTEYFMSRRFPLAPAVPSPTGGWKGMGASRHFVQFFDRDAVMLDSVCGFLGGGLLAGDACVVIATPAHLDEIDRLLLARGFDLDAAREWKQYVTLDAGKTLARFMVDGMPDADLFHEVIGSVIASAEQAHPRVLAFGEMVALLCLEGKHDAALELEKLWNVLARRHGFSLFCAYPMNSFDGDTHAKAFADLCAEHSGIIHAESHSA